MLLLGPATCHIMNCVRTKKRLVVHFNRLKPWISNENVMEQPDCVPIQNVPEAIPTGRTAVPHNTTTTGDKMEDIVVYLPQQQENPLPLDLEDGHAWDTGPQRSIHHNMQMWKPMMNLAPNLLHSRRLTRIRQPSGWYGDRIILSDKVA